MRNVSFEPGRRSTRWIWMTILVFASFAALAFPVVLFWAYGLHGAEMVDNWRGLPALDQVNAIAAILFGGLSWAMLVRWCRSRWRDWWKRRWSAADIRSEMERIEQASSRSGNILAWMFAAIFLVLGLLLLVAVSTTRG